MLKLYLQKEEQWLYPIRFYRYINTQFIYDRTQRFNQLENGIKGISQKMLTQQLRQMEADGLIIRKVYPEVPPKVEYSLSELGRSLKPVLDSMNIWGENYIKANKHLYKD